MARHLFPYRWKDTVIIYNETAGLLGSSHHHIPPNRSAPQRQPLPRRSPPAHTRLIITIRPRPRIGNQQIRPPAFPIRSIHARDEVLPAGDRPGRRGAIALVGKKTLTCATNRGRFGQQAFRRGVGGLSGNLRNRVAYASCVCRSSFFIRLSMSLRRSQFARFGAILSKSCADGLPRDDQPKRG